MLKYTKEGEHMKLGFIGLGNMSQAIIKGLLNNNYNKYDIFASGKDLEKLKKNTESLGIQYTTSNQACIDQSDIIFLGVKPENLEALHVDFKDKLVVSMAAKTNLKTLKEIFGPQKFIRIMPNLNVSINQGVIAYTAHNIEKNILSSFVKIISNLGHLYEIKEEAMSEFIALAGSAPALIYRFIDAMSQDEVFDKNLALEIVAHTMIGSAQYVLDSHIPPHTLIKNVSSKGGTTIEGLKIFDAYDFETMIKHAKDAIIKKDKMG